MPISESEQYNLLDQLAEEFADRFRRGERPSLEEYSNRYPELAEDIRELFPAMVKVEQVDEGKIAHENDLKALGPTSSLRQIGDYRILGVIGRGGMGVVYEAEQISLGRRVALKVLPRHAAADRLTLERFRREARAAARLHHTNIVPVFDVGQDGDIRFYAMQFIQGQSLDGVITELRHLRIQSQSKASAEEKAKSSPETRKLSPSVAHSILAGGFLPEGDVREKSVAAGDEATEAGPFSAIAPDSSSTPTPLSWAVLPGGTQLSVAEMSHRVFHRSVAHIGRQAAGALVHAHARGVIHRDIKPSNLLLDTDGVVWVTDFGLAKAEDDGLTQTGDVLGTIRYMAPERFLGQADPRSDVYALGLTLYELLVLRPAFDSPNRLALIEQVRSVDPPRPRSIDPRIPLDLETIVLKAVEKDAKARYASADEMSEDLRRFLADEPIRARQVSTRERYWRWAMRNPAIATLGGVLTALSVAVTVGSMMTAGYFQRLAGSEKQAKERLQVAQNAADGARREALEERDHSRRQSARLALDKGIALAETGEAARGLHWMLEGLKVAPAEDAEIQRVIRINLSAWSEQVHGLRHIIRVPARSVAPATAAYRCAFSPDGRVLAIATADRLELRDAKSLEPTGKSLVFESLPEAFAFSPDGKTIVTGHQQGGVERWDVTTGERVGVPLPHGGMVRTVAYSPDGTTIVSGCSDGTMRIWSSRTGEPLAAPFKAGQPVYSVAFSPDGKSILIGTGSEGQSGAAYLWDVASQAKLAGPLPHPDTVFAVAFNPAGTTFLTACRDGTAQLWDRNTNRPHGDPLWHRQAVYGAMFTPDGATILTRPRDELSVFLWEAVTGQRIGTPLWHQGPLDCVAVSPDGRTVLTGGVDESARLWEIGRNRSRPLDPSLRNKRPVNPGPQNEPRLPDYLLKKTIAFSADRKTVLTSDGGRIARLWETSTGRPLGATLQHVRNVRTVAMSPDGTRAATASHDFNGRGEDGNVSAIHLWDAATGRPLAPPIGRDQWVSALAFSPDGRVIASGDYGRTVRFWDAVTGHPAGALIEQRGIVFSVAFSPDGTTLAVGTVDSANEARLWDLATRRPKGKGMPHKDWVVDVAFSPDGRVLLTRSHDATARLWDAASGEPLTDYLRNEGLPAAAFSPDGRRVATAGNLEDQARIWDARTGQVLPGSTLSQGSQVTALAFSPDGRILGVGCKDGSARLWDVATAKPLGPPMVQRSTIVAVTFNQPGRALLATAADGTTRSWPLPLPILGNTDQIGLRLEVLTGLRMNSGQDVEKLASPDWDERCRRLTDLEGSVALAYASSVSEMDYHEARARDAEQDGNAFAARWHLDRLISMRAAVQNAGSVPDLVNSDGVPPHSLRTVSPALEGGARGRVLRRPSSSPPLDCNRGPKMLATILAAMPVGLEGL
jgi:eukaryotic-like serine/threonine-protein kinase